MTTQRQHLKRYPWSAQAHTRKEATTATPVEKLGEELGRFLGLDELGERIISRLDRIERRLDSLNITPAELDMLEKARASLTTSDETIDSIAADGS
jgi:hypothetical protein